MTPPHDSNDSSDSSEPGGSGRSGPLAGIRVLDCSTVLAGPLCAQILGDYGADVIKVEHPDGGDPFRTHGPSEEGVALWWRIVGRNKRSVGLYLGDPDGAAVFTKLAATADVVVEGFRPGTLERWGVGWDVLHALNPRLVLVSVTGFGQGGPMRDRPGFGTLAEAMSGFAAVTGEPDGPPTLPAMGLADSIAGITAFGAAMTALWHRDRPGGSGTGQHVDVSLLEPMVCAVGPGPTVFDRLGTLPERTGNRSTSNAPRNAYRTADDRWLAVSASTTSIATRIMALVGRADLAAQPWFGSAHDRAAHGDEIDAAVAAWIAERPAAEVVAAFEAAEAAIAPVHDAATLLDDPQVRAQDLIPTVDDPELGPIRMPGPLFRMSDGAGSIRSIGRTAVGADTDEVLTGPEVGLTADELHELRERGVVR